MLVYNNYIPGLLDPERDGSAVNFGTDMFGQQNPNIYPDFSAMPVAQVPSPFAGIPPILMSGSMGNGPVVQGLLSDTPGAILTPQDFDNGGIADSSPMILAAGDFLPRGQMPRPVGPSTNEPSGSLEDFPVLGQTLMCDFAHQGCLDPDLVQDVCDEWWCTPKNAESYTIKRGGDPAWTSPDTPCRCTKSHSEINPYYDKPMPGGV